MATRKSNKLDKDINVINASGTFSDLDEFKKDLRKEFGSNAALKDNSDELITAAIVLFLCNGI